MVNHSSSLREFIILSSVKIPNISLQLVQSIDKNGLRLIKCIDIDKISIVQIHICDRIHDLLSLLVFICLSLGLGGCLS